MKKLIPEFYPLHSFRRENSDVFSLEIQLKEHFFFQPGQFNMLCLPGIGEVAISISGDPEESSSLRHTIREVGSVTEVMAKMKKGDLLGIRGPFGQGWPIKKLSGKDLLLVAGGLGIAPLRPLIHLAKNNRGDFSRIILLYGVKKPENFIFSRELARWEKKINLEVWKIVEIGDENWQAEVGLITDLLPKISLDPKRTVMFTCGPEIMMRFAALTALEVGLKEENIFLSLERNMKCATGFCGHCLYGPFFICRDGPVFPYHRLKNLLPIQEL